MFCFFFLFSSNYSSYLDSTTALSVVHLSPLGSQVSFATASATRIENVVDWVQIANKYRALMGDVEETGSMSHTEGDERSNSGELPTAAVAQVGNNINANAVNPV